MLKTVLRITIALLLVVSVMPAFKTGKAAGADLLIVADHTKVDLYSQIPQYWIDQVKKMRLNAAGESHATGYLIGLRLLAQLNANYPASVKFYPDLPESYRTDALRADGYVYGVGHGTGDQQWYTWHAYTNPADAGWFAGAIKAHLDYNDNTTSGIPIFAMGYGWCYDMMWQNEPGGVEDPVYHVHWAGKSENGPDGDKRWGLSDTLSDNDTLLTGNRMNMDDYLQATAEYIQYIALKGYNTNVFFTTGPVEDGWDPGSIYSGERGYQREIKHNYIRNYVNTNNKILFDYADILSYNNAGVQNTVSWTDSQNTTHAYPFIHPDNMKDLNGQPAIDDGDHIGEAGAVRLAKALWWMLARMAGWDGTPASQVISITITDASPAGIHFGSLSTGTTNNPDTDANSATPSITVRVDAGTTVNVDLQIKGTDFVASTFPVTNAKYSLTYAGGKTALSTAYATFAANIAPSGNATLWHWLNVPSSGVSAGSYSSNISYKAIVH